MITFIYNTFYFIGWLTGWLVILAAAVFGCIMFILALAAVTNWVLG